MTAPVFVCPRCGKRSGHPRDLEHGYCGNCHDFTADPATAQLLALLLTAGLPAGWGESGRWLKIETGKVTVTIEPRPVYCDRGRWIAKAFPSGDLFIDGQDGWPRYYFGAEACATEIRAWMQARDCLPTERIGS